MNQMGKSQIKFQYHTTSDVAYYDEKKINEFMTTGHGIKIRLQVFNLFFKFFLDALKSTLICNFPVSTVIVDLTQ